MAGRTSRFGLNKFGGTQPGTINDDGQKFTGLDRDTIDRLFSTTEQHDHHYHALQAGLSETPVLTLLTDGGTLRGGVEYFYRFSLVDALGNETLASAEESVVTPALLAAPGMPMVDLNEMEEEPAGTLTPGIYYYALTALRGNEESVLGPALAISVPAGQGAVPLALPAYGSADGYQVWRLGATEIAYTRISTVDTPVLVFTDDGSVPADPCACDPSSMPPTSNTGVSSYAVEVELPVGADLTGYVGWRIYRSTRSGVYDTAALVHLVTELNDELDPLSGIVMTWTDVGDPLQTGMPMDFDQNMRFQPLTLDSADELPLPAGYPEYYPLMVRRVLYILRDGEWATVSDASGTLGGAASLTSLDGSRWLLGVDNLGALFTEATVFPGPPATPVIVVDEGAVSWTAPANGGSALTGYIVRYFDGLDVVEYEFGPLVLATVLPAVGYVQVIAENQYGRSMAAEQPLTLGS